MPLDDVFDLKLVHVIKIYIFLIFKNKEPIPNKSDTDVSLFITPNRIRFCFMININIEIFISTHLNSIKSWHLTQPIS